jgi:hypothetical protein
LPAEDSDDNSKLAAWRSEGIDVAGDARERSAL